jgi:hypothetical protein
MTIYLDPFGLHTLSVGDWLVTDDASYIEARRLILAYKKGVIKEAITIVVTDKIIVNWFGDVPTQYVQPRQQLQVRFPGSILPADLKDADILALGLLDNSLSDTDLEPTESSLLKYFFGKLLSGISPYRRLSSPVTH